MNNLCDEDAQDEDLLTPDWDSNASVETRKVSPSPYEDDNDCSTDGDREFGFGGNGGCEEEVIEEWRPLSPEGVNFDEDRYEL